MWKMRSLGMILAGVVFAGSVSSVAIATRHGSNEDVGDDASQLTSGEQAGLAHETRFGDCMNNAGYTYETGVPASLYRDPAASAGLHGDARRAFDERAHEAEDRRARNDANSSAAGWGEQAELCHEAANKPAVDYITGLARVQAQEAQRILQEEGKGGVVAQRLAEDRTEHGVGGDELTTNEFIIEVFIGERDYYQTALDEFSTCAQGHGFHAESPVHLMEKYGSRDGEAVKNIQNEDDYMAATDRAHEVVGLCSIGVDDARKRAYAELGE